MNRFLILTALIISVIGTSCDQAKTSEKVTPDVAKMASDTLTIPLLSGLKPTLKLTKEANEVTKNWTFYKDLAQEIDSLSGETMGELRPRISRISKIFIEKENAEEAEAPNVPETVQTKAIESRILAIETQLNILRNNSDRNMPDVNQVAVAMVKVKNGLQNLNLQLNERFSLSIKDLLEEIKNEDNDTPNVQGTSPRGGRPEIQVIN